MGIAPRFVKKLGIRSISVDWPITGGYAAIENVQKAGVEGYFCEVGKESMPIEDESVDLVLLADVLEHLIHSPKPVLEEIRRILKPNGICIATTPNATRITVRITDDYKNVLGIGRLYKNIIWIPKKGVNQSKSELRCTVYHEILHTVFGVGHHEGDKLMGSIHNKGLSKKEIQERFLYWANKAERGEKV